MRKIVGRQFASGEIAGRQRERGVRFWNTEFITYMHADWLNVIFMLSASPSAS